MIVILVCFKKKLIFKFVIRDYTFILYIKSGYAGQRCDVCGTGFFGQPAVIGQKCHSCDCHGNVDLTEEGSCNAITGDCLKCQNATCGRHCEYCCPDYWGDAIIRKDCQGRFDNGEIFNNSIILQSVIAINAAQRGATIRMDSVSANET